MSRQPHRMKRSSAQHARDEGPADAVDPATQKGGVQPGDEASAHSGSSAAQTVTGRKREIQQVDDEYFLRLSKRIGGEWKDLAKRLGFDRAKVEAFQANNEGNFPEQCRTMLVSWFRLQENSEEAPIRLLEALKEVGLADLAQEVSKDTRPSIDTDLGYCQRQVYQFYENKFGEIQAHPLLPDRTIGIDELYIHLDLNGHLRGKTKPLEYVVLLGKRRRLDKAQVKSLGTWEDMFKPEVVGESMVILSGRAGCGKSTLLNRIATKCGATGSNSPVTKFKLVFLLRLKLMLKSSCVIDAIFDQILPKDTKLTKSKLKGLIAENEASVAFLLDGLDEIPVRVLESTAGEYRVKDLLDNRVLVSSFVLVATRPHMVEYILSSYPHYARVETSGFSSKNVKQYIRSYFSADVTSGEALISRLESSHLQGLAGIPLVSCMLCMLWKDQASIPERLTEVYSDFAKVLPKIRSNKSLDERQMNSLLDGLGRTALTGLLDPEGDRLVFFPEEFNQEVSGLDDGITFGYLQQEKSTSGVDVVKVITFLHRTLQEYCAAHHLVSLREDDKKYDRKGERRTFHCQLQHLRPDNVHRLEYLLRFCCGLSRDAAGLLLEHIRDMKIEPKNEHQLQSLARLLLFESKSKGLVCKLQRPSGVECQNQDDLLSLRYFLDCDLPSQTIFTLTFKCGSYQDIMLLRQILPKVIFAAKIIDYTISDHGREILHLRKTLELVKKPFLRLNVNFAEESCTEGFVSETIFGITSEFPGSVTLCMFGRPYEDVVRVVNTLQQPTNLLGFHLGFINMHGHLTNLAPLFKSYLYYLILFMCKLDDDDAKDLISILPVGHDLASLHLVDTTFSLEGVKTLTRHLRSLPKLDDICLYGTRLPEDNVKEVVERNLPHLKELENLRGFFSKM